MADPSLQQQQQQQQPPPPASSQPSQPQTQLLSQEPPSSSTATTATAAATTAAEEPAASGATTTSTTEAAPAVADDPDPIGGDDIDASVENEISMTAGENAAGAGQNGTTATATATANESPGNPGATIAPGIPGAVGAGIPVPPPTKKESSLREFLGKMDEYAPIIPDAVTAHYLTVAGLPPPGNGPNQTPPHLARLLALATQKFIADIAADAYQYSRIRASNSASANNPMGGLNAAAGLNMPSSSNLAGGGAGGAAGGAAAGGAGGDTTGKGKSGMSNTHLGIQRPGFGGGGQGGSGQGRTVLTMEDLGMAVAEYGVSVKRGEFYR